MPNGKYVERVDALTGCANLLAFLETFSARLAGDACNSFSLLLVDLNNFMEFNTAHGRDQGDAVLHWISIVLKDTDLPVYRIGGDEFLVRFDEGSPPERVQIAQAVFERLNNESSQYGWEKPASVMMIHFNEEQLEVADLWIAISDALFDAKVSSEQGFLVNTYTHASALNNYQLRVINLLTERLLSFAYRLDATHQIAYLDQITELPNSLAAEIELKRAIELSRQMDGPFSILFIDGDNLRLYNEINYSAGDQMLRRLSEVLAQHLRPGDFLARWRVGDEFLVVLPDTAAEKALAVAERLRSAVEAQSKVWEIPITVSIGVATCPEDGRSHDDLLASVEKAAKLSKDNGKNQVNAVPRS